MMTDNASNEPQEMSWDQVLTITTDVCARFTYKLLQLFDEAASAEISVLQEALNVEVTNVDGVQLAVEGLVQKIEWLIDTYAEWPEHGHFTFPDGEVWSRPEHMAPVKPKGGWLDAADEDTDETDQQFIPPVGDESTPQ